MGKDKLISGNLVYPIVMTHRIWGDGKLGNIYILKVETELDILGVKNWLLST